MKHAVIVSHPREKSFALSVASVYCEAVRAQGHEALLRDLYRMNFAPCLAETELPKRDGFAPGQDVQREQQLLREADVFVFVYPLWMNAQPAMMKGYIDRVFGMGFAYKSERGGNAPLLAGRKMISFTSSGAPMDWVTKTGAWDAVRKLFDEHFAAVCGLEVIDHVHFGSVVPGIRADVVAGHLDRVKALARRADSGVFDS